jgi:hypothetical protein
MLNKRPEYTDVVLKAKDAAERLKPSPHTRHVRVSPSSHSIQYIRPADVTAFGHVSILLPALTLNMLLLLLLISASTSRLVSKSLSCRLPSVSLSVCPPDVSRYVAYRPGVISQRVVDEEATVHHSSDLVAPHGDWRPS